MSYQKNAEKDRKRVLERYYQRYPEGDRELLMSLNRRKKEIREKFPTQYSNVQEYRRVQFERKKIMAKYKVKKETTKKEDIQIENKEINQSNPEVR